jgi:Ca2+-binding EF-hand superfamily protein
MQSSRQRAVERRTEIREFIRNQRDPIVMKWKALEETIFSEDRRRNNFFQRRFKEDTTVLPITIRKFIGTLRKAVRVTMRNKGGTPYSIIRNMFLYWDADKSGAMSVHELAQCMNSLGVKISEPDLRAIVKHYDNGQGEEEMSYFELLNDLNRGEPTLTDFVGDQDEKVGLRFEEVQDAFVEMPPIVEKFIEACRNYVKNRMIVVGGTPQEHVRVIFSKYDKDIKGGLNPAQLSLASRRTFKLQMTEKQAEEVIRYYDRKFRGFMDPSKFVDDVCRGMESYLHFTELTAEVIESEKQRIAANPFTVQPHKTKPNKVFEKFKDDVMHILNAKVYSDGGSKRGWLKEAFRFWDPRDLGVLKEDRQLVGAMRRIGLHLSKDEADVIMREYDDKGNGDMNYYLLIDDIVKKDPHFLEDATVVDFASARGNASSVTARAPIGAAKGSLIFRKAAEAYARKSGGYVEPRDVLHGTFVRFDTRADGRVDTRTLRMVCDTLGVRINDRDMKVMIAWFDTDGTERLDYNELTRQLFGEDIATRPVKLPPVPSPTKMNTMASPDIGSSAAHGPGHGHGKSGQLDLRTLRKNLQDIESPAKKEQKKAHRKQQILEEKANIQLKLASIERQRRKILEDHHRHMVAKRKDSSVTNHEFSGKSISTHSLH